MSLIVTRRVHRRPSQKSLVSGAAYTFASVENARARARGVPPPFVGLNIGYDINQRSATPVCLTGSVSTRPQHLVVYCALFDLLIPYSINCKSRFLYESWCRQRYTTRAGTSSSVQRLSGHLRPSRLQRMTVPCYSCRVSEMILIQMNMSMSIVKAVTVTRIGVMRLGVNVINE